MRKVDVLCITLTSPIKIGLYEKNRLIDTLESHEKSSDVLPLIFKDI